MSASTTVESMRAARGDEPPLTRRRVGDHRPRDLLDHLRPESPDELAQGRLIRQALGQRDPTKPPQMQRVRDLPDQRLIAPARALLDHHQPQQPLDRDRRPPEVARRRIQAASTGASNAGSANSPSSAARSAGNSRTSTGNPRSNSDSTCPPDNRSIHPPITRFAGQYLLNRPDRTSRPNPDYFRGK